MQSFSRNERRQESNGLNTWGLFIHPYTQSESCNFRNKHNPPQSHIHSLEKLIALEVITTLLLQETKQEILYEGMPPLLWCDYPLQNQQRCIQPQDSHSIFQLKESLGQTNKRKEFISCASIKTNQICDENRENLRRVSIETLELTRSSKSHPKQLYQMLEKPPVAAFKLDSLKRYTLAGKDSYFL